MVVEDEVEFYISNISSMKERRNFTLEVHFKHMKMHNREWAFSCCNRLEYLKPLFIQATENFLIEQNVSDNEDLIRMRTKLNFIGMPNSIETIDDYIKGKELVKYKRLFAEDADEKNKTDVVILTAVGRMIFLRLLSLLLDLHERNMTLAGGFSLEHIVVIDGVCSILLNPKLATPDDRAKDLRCLEKILTPYYQCKVEEKGSKVMLPLYFKDLQKNLKTADDAMVKEKWFRDYLRFHAAIMPSRGRRNLILGITKVIRKFEQAVAGSSFWTALQHPPPVCLNWRRDAELSKCKIISGVYHHKSESKYEGKQGEEKSVDQSGEQSDYKPNGTALELLIFTHEHGDEYVEISDHDEIELYQAHQLCHFLPWLLRRMLSNCNMMKHFGSTWSNYRSSRYDDWDGY
uniref:Uncharacterized protein n=2 Tax=Oryza brachyantha TaxID=4533 RepID=J3N086_ORYBR